MTRKFISNELGNNKVFFCIDFCINVAYC